jgi:hypothetical protein
MPIFSLPLATLCLAAQSTTAGSYDHYFYPLAKPLPCPKIEIDASKVEDQRAWLEAAGKLVHDWYPYVTSLLASDIYKNPKVIRLVLQPSQDAPAYTVNDTITISGAWIKEHPDDFGMVIHELTHVVQQYPDSSTTPGWLVEGIADYVRWWRYEPDAPRPRIDVAKATYHDAYRTTAYWLAFIIHRYDARIVSVVDRDMKLKIDPMPEFQKLTGKTPDELWAEFVTTLRR